MIDQAKGVLILLYGVDDHSQNTNIKLRALAEQLMFDYRALSNEAALPSRMVCSKTPMTVRERITPDPN